MTQSIYYCNYYDKRVDKKIWWLIMSRAADMSSGMRTDDPEWLWPAAGPRWRIAKRPLLNVCCWSLTDCYLAGTSARGKKSPDWKPLPQVFLSRTEWEIHFFFFAHPFCTSYCLLHIVLFFCTSYCFALFLFHCTFYSYFSFSYHMYALVLCYFI